MFVRVKTTPNSPRRSIQICENTWVNNKTKQKIVRYVGIAQDADEEQKLKDYAKTLIPKLMTERHLKQPQTDMFDLTESETQQALSKMRGRPKTKKIEDILPPDQVSLFDVKEESRIIEGVHDVAGCMFDELYGSLFSGKKKLLELLKDIVLTRLVYPGSKHKSQQHLKKQFDKSYSLDAIYRMMDALFPRINSIKQLTFEKTASLFPRGVDLLLFDVTTLYFESTEVDDLRNFGYSKDHRFNTTQVVLALATNSDGLPVGYELFEGNKAEVTTLVAAIASWKKLFHIASVCFVGDRALFTEKNIQLLESCQYQYIIAAKLRKLSQPFMDKIFQEQFYQPTLLKEDLAWISDFPFAFQGTCDLFTSTLIPDKEAIHLLPIQSNAAYVQVGNQLFYIHKIRKECQSFTLTTQQLKQLKIPKKTTSLSEKKQALISSFTGHAHHDNRLIVSYKSKRALKDEQDRQHLIDKIKKNIGNGANPNKLITNTGVKKFITRDKNAKISLDEEKVLLDAQWDGLHGVITNIKEDSPESIVARYAKLWVIEESFRINKHTLQMRPIFHFKPERIQAHIAICYMTFSVLRHLQYRVNLTQKISIQEILDELLNVQASIHIHQKTKDRYKMPGYFTHNARKIYKAFNIERSLDASVYLN